MTCKTNSNKLKISINKEVLKHIEKSINNRIQIIVTNKKNSLQSHNTQCMLIQKVQNVQFLKKYQNQEYWPQMHNSFTSHHKSHRVAPEQMHNCANCESFMSNDVGRRGK